MANQHPEADLQRTVVACLQLALPKGSIVHHSPNEQGGGEAARRRQAILVGMGVHPGWTDVVLLVRVLGAPFVLFLELKSATGRLTKEEKDFRDDVLRLGFGWALVRSVDDALDACRKWGVDVRIRSVTRAPIKNDRG